MLDKMTSNQRLILAVGLSFVFFVVYTAMFPPPPPEVEDQNQTRTQYVAANTPQSNNEVHVKPVANLTGHSTASDESINKSETNTLVTIDSDDFIISIDTLGRISSKILKDEKYHDGDNNPAQMIPLFGAKPLYLRFSDESLNTEASKIAYVASTDTLDLTSNTSASVTLTQTLSSVSVTKKLTFYKDGHYDINVELSNEKRYFIYLGQHPQSGAQQMMTVKGAMVYAGDNLTTIFEDGDVETRSSYTDVHLTSAFDQYFASIFYGLRPDTSVLVERDRDDNAIIYLDATRVMDFNAYIGPKDYKVLDNIDPVLTNAIEYGWFTFASKPLFDLLMWLYGIFGNWGWAIIALTIIIRLLLFPLTYKGMLSMQKMKDLAPKIKEIQAKYKGDPQRMNAAVMDTYKKHGANPLGGCLPMLLQIPVFFAIYRVLLNAVELQGAPWMLWIDDLSRMDPTFILPILMGASMYYQQKLTPNNFTDPMQQKVFQFLPIIFTFFFITFPSGLVLYWFVNNLFSIAQQFLVNHKYEAAKEARHELHLEEKHKHDKD
ncbi:MAG: membrane protein insertase YidC [Campylobacterota bacterium]|nr:membrane protein insertase YidC [Campylobacterota bacterium]